MPSYVCIAPLNAVRYSGLEPKVADIGNYFGETGLNINAAEIMKKISNQTRAIIAPHILGDGIKDITDIINLGIPVIEDCALSIGAEIGDQGSEKKAGSFSGISVYSFAATKVMTAAGTGGMVLTDSENLLKIMQNLTRYDGRERYNVSYNFKMGDIQAAFGREQLRKLDSFIDRRRKIAGQYDEGFSGVKGIKIPYRTNGSIFFRYVISVDDPLRFMEKMADHGIDCARPIFNPLHRYLGLDGKKFPNTENAQNHLVSIPIYPSLNNDQVSYIIDTVRKVGNKI
jgi:perosamine synthetase